mgnify:CR=1 FL=1
MNYTRALFSSPGLRGVVVVALAAMVMAVPSWNTTASASDEGSGAALGTDVIPPPEEHDGPDGESELPWLFAVFFVTWAAFFGYVYVLSRRQREMRREIEALRRALADWERQALEAGPESGTPQSQH